MQLVSLIWGILALVGMLAGFVPFYGALNWLLIPFAGVGAIVSAVAAGAAQEGESKAKSLAGLICCGIATIFGLIRLVVGFGVF
jgi:hypothetical protein